MLRFGDDPGSSVADPGSSRIYIDFGHHLAGSRAREAACMGNIVFLHEKGAAAFFEDHRCIQTYIHNPRCQKWELAFQVREVLRGRTPILAPGVLQKCISMEKEG